MLLPSGNGMSRTWVFFFSHGKDDVDEGTQYATPVSKKALKALPTEAKEGEEKKLSNHAQRNLDARKKGACSL